jgi:hypothetical protein
VRYSAVVSRAETGTAGTGALPTMVAPAAEQQSGEPSVAAGANLRADLPAFALRRAGRLSAHVNRSWSPGERNGSAMPGTVPGIASRDEQLMSTRRGYQAQRIPASNDGCQTFIREQGHQQRPTAALAASFRFCAWRRWGSGAIPTAGRRGACRSFRWRA